MKVYSTRIGLKFFSIAGSIAVYCLKILGLAPFSVHMKNYNKNPNLGKARVFLFSKIGLAYSILLSVLVPVMAALLSVHLFSLSYQNESPVTRATDRSDGILCVLTSWIIITNWTFNQRKAVSILNRISEIHVKLSGRRQAPFKQMDFVFVTTHVIVNVSLWVTIFTTESVDPVISDPCANWLFLIIPSFVIYCFIIEYFLVVAFVAKKLETVNKNLSNFNELRYYFAGPSFFNGFPTGWSLATRNRLQGLNLLCNFRMEIFEICHDIAGFFSFPILACVSYSFFSLIVNSYYLINVFVLENGDFSIGGVFSAVTWLFLGLYPLSLLLFQVTKTVTEAKVTGRLVHKLLSTAIKEEIKTELEHFSLRLLHENFDFTAYGFFTLDFTLLHSMLGAAATYLVILIQFQK